MAFDASPAGRSKHSDASLTNLAGVQSNDVEGVFMFEDPDEFIDSSKRLPDYRNPIIVVSCGIERSRRASLSITWTVPVSWHFPKEKLLVANFGTVVER